MGPLGYLEFSRAIGENHAHTRARLPPALSQSSGVGAGSAPTWPGTIFLNWATQVWCYKRVSTHSATRSLHYNY